MPRGRPKGSPHRYERPSLNSYLIESGHKELPIFYQYAQEVGTEMAMTEYAARLCYNSFAKIGSAPNFVQNVLGHGHLSVAEHASLAVNFSGTHMNKMNKYFVKAGTLICGNLHTWIEHLAVVSYQPYMEVFLATFPAAFVDSPLAESFDANTFQTPVPFHVPSFDSVHLIAVNFGNLNDAAFNESQERYKWARLTWLVEDVSRACSHQVARHRLASLSEQSLRYVDAGKVVGFVYPPGASPVQIAFMKEQYEAAFHAYQVLRKDGVKKEDARFVLPLATKTRFIFSMNLQDLLHFFKIRCASDAQWEVRQMAERMLVQSVLATKFKPLVALAKEFELEGKNDWNREG